MHIYLGKYRSNGITNNYVFAVGTMSMQNQVHYIPLGKIIDMR